MPRLVRDFDFGGTDTVAVTLTDGNHVIAAMMDVELRQRTAIFRGIHIQGGGRNTLGLVALRALIAWTKEYLDIDELRIEGAIRTSGAGPGHLPAVLVF